MKDLFIVLKILYRKYYTIVHNLKPLSSKMRESLLLQVFSDLWSFQDLYKAIQSCINSVDCLYILLGVKNGVP